MAPIPQVIKKKPTRAQTTTVGADNVIDDFGRTLTYLQRRQKSLDQQQDKNTTVARQHAAQNESDNKNTLVYRDVFPGRKYKLALNDVLWIGGDNTLTIGYTVDNEFTPIEYKQDENEFQFQIPPTIQKVDTIEVRMTGVSESIRGYMEDDSASSSLWDKIKELIQEILGLKEKIEDLEEQISSINDAIADLDERVTALEEKE
jgi:prefoldin subunit 5